MIAIEILAYISVGIITLSWLFSIIYELAKKTHSNYETNDQQTE